MQTDVATEILETLHRAGEEDVGQDVESRIKHLPRTNPDFEATKLYGIVSGQLQAHLGEAVNEAVDSKELQFAHGDCVSPGAVDEVVARLAASPSFADVVQGARACLQRAGRLKNAACDVPPAAGAAAAVGGTTTKDERIHLHRNDMSSSDTEGEGMHAKKKALRMDDWVGTFCLSGGGGGRGFSPRIDVEAALGQLEAGLGSPGGSATSATEALGLLAEVRVCTFSLPHEVLVYIHRHQCDQQGTMLSYIIPGMFVAGTWYLSWSPSTGGRVEGHKCDFGCTAVKNDPYHVTARRKLKCRTALQRILCRVSPCSRLASCSSVGLIPSGPEPPELALGIRFAAGRAHQHTLVARRRRGFPPKHPQQKQNTLLVNPAYMKAQQVFLCRPVRHLVGALFYILPPSVVLYCCC